MQELSRWSESAGPPSIVAIRVMIAEVKLAIVIARLVRLARRAGYDPSQPRAPRGQVVDGELIGGQWVDSGGAGGVDGNEATVRVAQSEARKYPVNLAVEEVRGGHTIAKHVGKTDAELMARMYPSYRFGIVELIPQRYGSFSSIDAANDLVNRTIERNTAVVDLVASGAILEDLVVARFGFVTGKEAFRPLGYPDAYMRPTYSVGVFIQHDSSRLSGFKVLTAYPRNELPK